MSLSHENFPASRSGGLSDDSLRHIHMTEDRIHCDASNQSKICTDPKKMQFIPVAGSAVHPQSRILDSLTQEDMIYGNLPI